MHAQGHPAILAVLRESPRTSGLDLRQRAQGPWLPPWRPRRLAEQGTDESHPCVDKVYSASFALAREEAWACNDVEGQLMGSTRAPKRDVLLQSPSQDRVREICVRECIVKGGSGVGYCGHCITPTSP